MRSIFIMRGLPGSGKSTAATELAKNPQIHVSAGDTLIGDWPVHSADHYFESIGEDGKIVYNFDATKLYAAHMTCQRKVEADMIAKVQKIFVANTFTTPKEMKDYYEMAENHGYKVFSLIVENRHGNKNVHDVPGETLEKMRNRFDVKL